MMVLCMRRSIEFEVDCKMMEFVEKAPSVSVHRNRFNIICYCRNLTPVRRLK